MTYCASLAGDANNDLSAAYRWSRAKREITRPRPQPADHFAGYFLLDRDGPCGRRAQSSSPAG